jgi:hypothetical protein
VYSLHLLLLLLIPLQGVTKYDPKVVDQLASFVFRYSADVLQDAAAVAARAGAPGGDPSAADAMLAIRAHAQHNFVQPPSQQASLKKHALLFVPAFDVPRPIKNLAFSPVAVVAMSFERSNTKIWTGE